MQERGPSVILLMSTVKSPLQGGYVDGIVERVLKAIVHVEKATHL